MVLTDTEKKILSDIYEMHMHLGANPDIDNYDLESIQNERFQEVGYMLEKLKRLGLIDYDMAKAFTTGGRRNQKYHNNILMIWWEKLEITDEGVKAVGN